MKGAESAVGDLSAFAVCNFHFNTRSIRRDQMAVLVSDLLTIITIIIIIISLLSTHCG